MKTTIWPMAAAWLILSGGAAFRAQTQAQPLPTEIERTDLMTFAQGVLFVEQTGLAAGSSGTALQIIDGNPYRLGLTTDRRLPVEFG